MDSQNIKITFLGDIMFDSRMSLNINKYYIDGKLDFEEMFAPIKKMLSSSDYVMANLETPITKDASKFTNKEFEFCTSIEFAEAIKNAGIDYVSTANNHCLDRGIEGIKETTECLDFVGLRHGGVSNYKSRPLIINVGKLKIGIISYTYGTNAIANHNYLSWKQRKCVNLLQEQEGFNEKHNVFKKILSYFPNSTFIRKVNNKIHNWFWSQNDGKIWYEQESFSLYRKILLSKDVRYLKRKADFSIAQIHVGGQYNILPNFQTLNITHRLEKEGVNCIICNHEHVIHGSRVDGNQLTAYALGNVSGSAGILKAPFDRRSNYSIAVHVYIDTNANIKKITYSILKAVVTEKGKIEVWPVYELLSRLNNEERENTIQDSIKAAEDFSSKKIKNVLEELDLKVW